LVHGILAGARPPVRAGRRVGQASAGTDDGAGTRLHTGLLARWQNARVQPRHRGRHRRLHSQHQGRLLFTTLDRGALLRQLVTDLQSRRPADRVRIDAPGTAADLRDGGGRDGPAAVRAVRLRGDWVVQCPRVVTRWTGRRLPPRRRGYATGVCPRRAHAGGAAAHFSRAERGSNLGTRQPPYGVRVGSFGISAALDHRFGNRPYSPAAAAERRAAPGLVSASAGDRSVDPLNSERTRTDETPTFAPAERPRRGGHGRVRRQEAGASDPRGRSRRRLARPGPAGPRRFDAGGAAGGRP